MTREQTLDITDGGLARLCSDAYLGATIESDVAHALCVELPFANVVAFRGTDDGDEWMANLRRWPVQTEHGGVHRGWIDSLDTILVPLKHWLDSRGGTQVQVVLTGHSKGGAEAGVFAGWLLGLGYSVAGVTFGQPRFCDRRYGDWMLSRGLRWRRYVYENDLVPHVFPLFTHLGEERWFDGSKWRDGISLGRWLLGLLRVGREHSIESYRRAL